MSADTFYGSDFGALESFDPEIAGVLVSELDRIRGGLQLIASREHVQPRGAHRARLDAVQQILRRLSGRRYYGGQEFTDAVETSALTRVKKLFGAEHANVQPHSGAQANLAVYAAPSSSPAIPSSGWISHMGDT